MAEVVLSGEARLIEKLDRIEGLLVGLTKSAKPTSGDTETPLSKQALRREQGLTHLHRRPRSGIFIWKRKDELKGRIITRSTKTRDETIAIQIGAQFELAYQRQRAGLAVYDAYAKPLAPAVEHWLKSLLVTDRVRRDLTMQINRAIKLLRLSTFADLDDIQAIERRLLALEGTFNRLTIVTAFQKRLKQFSKWCARNRRYMREDPLAQWGVLPIPETHPHRPRRAVSPSEMARALLSAEALDRIYRREHPIAIVYLSLLVTGARFGALAGVDVPHLLRQRSRLDMGPSVGKKRKGEAAVDGRTLIELGAYVGQRTSGPLFLSPQGSRLEHARTLDHWREAFTFGLVDELWPDDVTRSEERTFHVARVLFAGRVPSVGGNPRQVRPETVRAREEHAREIRSIAERLREGVQARMVGIDLHALRKTHRTWAEAAGVHPLLIDKQIGHATAAGGAALEAAKALIVSPTGRKHYVDMGLEMIDARRSAEAVRRLLDDATEALLGSASGQSVFAMKPEQTAPVITLSEARTG